MRFFPHRYKEAWAVAKILDSRETWGELGKNAISQLDLDLGKLLP